MNQAHLRPLPKSDSMNWRTIIYVILLVSLTVVKALPRSYRDIGKDISLIFTLFFRIVLMTATAHGWLFGISLCHCLFYMGIFSWVKGIQQNCTCINSLWLNLDVLLLYGLRIYAECRTASDYWDEVYRRVISSTGLWLHRWFQVLQKPLKQSLGLFQPPSTVHEEVRQRSPRRDGTFWWLFRVAKLGYCSVFSFAGALTLSSPTAEGSYNDLTSH